MFISNILAVKAPDSPDSFQTPIYYKATKNIMVRVRKKKIFLVPSNFEYS